MYGQLVTLPLLDPTSANSRSDDPRLGSLLESCNSLESLAKAKLKVGLIGTPCDEGVLRNGGRPGAKEGPDVVRHLLGKMGTVRNPEFKLDLSSIHFEDLGNVVDNDSLEEFHQHIHEKVLKSLTAGFIPICVGGGNDQSYPNGTALIDYLKKTDTVNKEQWKMAVINVDAHLDVRPPNPRSHSGSPFRQILEHPQDGSISIKLIEFAAQGSQCSPNHANYVLQKGGEIHWLSEVKQAGVTQRFRDILDGLADHEIFFSFDIDSIQSSDCPGVSCPATVGISAAEALELCTEAGRRKNVCLMDISEYSPPIERDRTGRLVVNMIYAFLLGLAQR